MEIRFHERLQVGVLAMPGFANLRHDAHAIEIALGLHVRGRIVHGKVPSRGIDLRVSHRFARNAKSSERTAYIVVCHGVSAFR